MQYRIFPRFLVVPGFYFHYPESAMEGAPANAPLLHGLSSSLERGSEARILPHRSLLVGLFPSVLLKEHARKPSTFSRQDPDELKLLLMERVTLPAGRSHAAGFPEHLKASLRLSHWMPDAPREHMVPRPGILTRVMDWSLSMPALAHLVLLRFTSLASSGKL